MVAAAELREGMVLRMEGHIYKVLEAEYKSGAAKMGGVVKTKLLNLRTAHMWEPHFRPLERLEELDLERRKMEFLYAEGEKCTFMRPDTFEQVELPRAILGLAAEFLEPGMEVPVDFFEGEAISTVLPEVVDGRVATTAPPIHGSQDNAWKEAKLENGLTIHVPLFIAPGETVRVDVRTGRYVERVRAERKRIA